MRVCLLTTQVPFIRGGAEVLTETFHRELIRRKIDSEIVTIPFRTLPAKNLDACIDMSLAMDYESNFGSKVDRIVGLKFPTYYARHKNKSVWLLHQHREFYDLWESFPAQTFREQLGVADLRTRVQKLDHECMSAVKSVYTISKCVSDRLEKYNQVASEPLYPPPADSELFYLGRDDGYFFFPSRLNTLKRQELVIRALPRTSVRKVIFAGLPDNPPYADELKALAARLGVQDRVEWLGYISDQKKRELYANARAVVFVPKDEDLGYITMEGMLSSKAVITCSDSGGPLEFVKHQENGWIADPTPESLGDAMEEAWSNERRTRERGQLALQSFKEKKINWDTVVERLIHP